MASNKTEHYKLNQWVKSDEVHMDDFNADNAAIDKEMQNLNTSISNLATEVANCGNCKIVTGSYVGTGTVGSSNKTSINFSKTLGKLPALLIVFNKTTGYGLVALNGQTEQYASFEMNTVWKLILTWSGTTVSWYSTSGAFYQLNNSGETYYYVAIG